MTDMAGIALPCTVRYQAGVMGLGGRDAGSRIKRVCVVAFVHQFKEISSEGNEQCNTDTGNADETYCLDARKTVDFLKLVHDS